MQSLPNRKKPKPITTMWGSKTLEDIMATRNDVTGDGIYSRSTSAEAQRKYEDNWDLIFGKKDKKSEEVKESDDDNND